MRRSFMMGYWIGMLSLALGLLATEARAGVCTSDEEVEQYVKELERHARGGASPSRYWPCATPDSKFAPRVAKACATLVERHADNLTPQTQCVRWLLASGKKAVGAVDLLEVAMTSWDWNLLTDVSSDLRALNAVDDPRVRAFVADKLRTHLAAARSKPLRGWKANAWRFWQIFGLGVLRKHGDASDLPLIDELVAASKEAKVLRAAAAAKKEIAARTAE